MTSKKKTAGAVLGAKAAKGTTRGAGKAAAGAGKTLLSGGGHGRAARKAVRGAGRTALKGGARAATPRDPASTRYLRYGFFALVGFVVGALIARSSNREDASTFTGTTGQHTPDFGSPAGQRGETWGSGTPTGAAGGGRGLGPDQARVAPAAGGP